MKPTSLSALTFLIATYALLIPCALANVEKAIFIAPGVEQVLQYTASRATWHLGDLPKLTHANHTLQTNITTGFPSASLPSGAETWMLLDELTPGKRYEARICWPATEPASFNMEAFTLSEIMADRENLFHSLASAFSSRLSARYDPGEPLGMYGIRDGPSSRMLLRIQAKADYFTHDKDLMRSVPPVPVHIILDPFHFNVLPHSLLLIAFVLLAAVIAILTLLVYVIELPCFNALRSKGGIIMNSITLGEPDRDGDSGGEDGVGLFDFGGAQYVTRSVSRGRRSSRNPWGSAVAADPKSIHRGQAQKPLPRSSSPADESDEAAGQGQGRGGSARGGGKSKGKGKKGRKRKK